MQLPAGVFASRYGAKQVFGLGILFTGIFTLLSPPASYLGVQWLIVLRVLEGITEAVTHPAFNVLMGVWVPKLERSIFSAAATSGGNFGNVLMQPIAGYLSSLDLFDGWPLS